MKTDYKTARMFAFWCLLLAVPYSLIMPYLIRWSGASWQLNIEAWGNKHSLDILSPALFGSIAFLTFPKHKMNQAEQANSRDALQRA